MTAVPTTALDAERAVALEALADLRRELAAVAESTALVPDDEHDAEGSTVGFERARVSTLVAWAERRVAALEVAEERLRTGTYRRCRDCGGAIGEERQETLPTTEVCVTCARTGDSGGPTLRSGVRPRAR